MIPYQQYRENLLKGHLSCFQFCKDQLEKAKSDENNSFISLCEESSKIAAHSSDQRFSKNHPLPLDGMILAIKDNICTKDIETTCGSRILDGYKPPYNATVVDRIIESGGIILGKANMDEFAMGSSNETSFYGPVHNPLDKSYVPGGSSGGSAAAVASGLVHAALGSDTGGSVRLPAAYCGVYGFKPSYGMLSRYGLISFAPSLDQIGILSRSLDDARTLFDVIKGHDPADSTSLELADEEQSYSNREIELRNISIAVLKKEQLKYCNDDVRNNYLKNISKLKAEGANIHGISIPDPSTCLRAYYIIASAEASSNLARFDGIRYGNKKLKKYFNELDDYRSEGFGREVKRRILAGTFVLSEGYSERFYLKADKFRKYLSKQFTEILKSAHILMLPVSPSGAFERGYNKDNPINMYYNDLYTVQANLAGIPALNIPSGYDSNGLPLSLQFMAGSNRDNSLFDMVTCLSYYL